jgi:hypothetical protein
MSTSTSTQQTQTSAQGAPPSEEELRRAYEDELSRITTGDMILQSAASLLNIGGLRLGLVKDAKVQRDLAQVSDAIDAVRALLPIIERREGANPQSLRPLRDALSQLQMAYTRELQSAQESPAAGQPPTAQGAEQGAAEQGSTEQGSTEQGPAKQPAAPGAAPNEPKQEGSRGPGPAESSGRLWVPGR